MNDTGEGIPAGAAWAYEEWLKEQVDKYGLQDCEKSELTGEE